LHKFSVSALSRFKDLYDSVISLMDVVDNHREEIGDISNMLINVQTISTNNIIRLLTIISAIFLPFSLNLLKIYGTNFTKGFFYAWQQQSLRFLRYDCHNGWGSGCPYSDF